MLARISKYALKNIFRNKFLSVSSVLVLTLLMFFINILFILHDVSFKLIDSINSKLTISLYLNESYNKNSIEVIDLVEDIKSLWSDVKVEYKTKDQILDELRIKEPDLAKILERTNPLPDTISLSQIDISEYDLINSVIESKLFILAKDEADQDYFANYTSQYKKIKQVIKVLDLLQVWLYFVIAIFFVSISIIIYSIIWNFIYYFKDEIYITKLVGWWNQFINWPFAIQWVIYSFISFLLSLIIFLFILKNVNLAFWEIYFFEFNLMIFLVEMIVFVIIWWVSWFLSSRKYLSTK